MVLADDIEDSAAQLCGSFGKPSQISGRLHLQRLRGGQWRPGDQRQKHVGLHEFLQSVLRVTGKAQVGVIRHGRAQRRGSFLRLRQQSLCLFHFPSVNGANGVSAIAHERTRMAQRRIPRLVLRRQRCAQPVAD